VFTTSARRETQERFGSWLCASRASKASLHPAQRALRAGCTFVARSRHPDGHHPGGTLCDEKLPSSCCRRWDESKTGLALLRFIPGPRRRGEKVSSAALQKEADLEEDPSRSEMHSRARSQNPTGHSHTCRVVRPSCIIRNHLVGEAGDGEFRENFQRRRRGCRRQGFARRETDSTGRPPEAQASKGNKRAVPGFRRPRAIRRLLGSQVRAVG